MMHSSFVIGLLDNIDPLKDLRWVPDGDEQWFLPHFLDLKNNSYSGYWYTAKNQIEAEHSHSGISFGTMLRGKIKLLCDEREYLLSKMQNFFVPPNTLHSAELITEDNIFLVFGTVVGTTDYQNQKFDAQTYYDLVHAHYLKYDIPIINITNNFEENE